MSEGTVSLLIGGEKLVLHPQRAVLWPRCHTVIVADTHFGKSGYFGRHGIAVPDGSDKADRQRLTQLVENSHARRLIILGDFLHAPLPVGGPEFDALHSWLRQLATFLDIHVVSGNHDIGVAKKSLSAVRWWDSEMLSPPFRFIHDAQRTRSVGDEDRLFTLSGHIHPVRRLKELGRNSLRVPVFWQRARGLILPSFGAFTGGFAVMPDKGDHMFAVGPSGVVALG